MQYLIQCLFVVVTVLPYLTTLGAPKILDYIPELLSAVVLPYVLVVGSKSRYSGVAPKYWLAFAALGAIATSGVVANGVSSPAFINGLRFYLRALPFFFIPAVYEFSDDEIRKQLRLLLLLALLQFPVSVFQRWIILRQGRFSGDDVQGTLLDSGTESIILICAALVLTAAFLRGQIRKSLYFPLLFLLIFPTTINETKVTVFYIPLGFAIALLVGSAPKRRLRTMMTFSVLLVVFAAIFIPVYNEMLVYSPFKKDKDIVSFFTDPKKFDRYMSSDVKGVGTHKDIRRGDAIEVPFKYISNDPIHLALGLGMGNTSPSAFGRSYEGRYHGMFSGFLITSFTYFILEIGVLGVAALLVLYGLIFSDSLYASSDPTIIGTIAVGWTAVTALLCVSLTYSPIHMFSSLSYLFWYFSGLVCAHRVRLTRRALPQVPDFLPEKLHQSLVYKEQPR